MSENIAEKVTDLNMYMRSLLSFHEIVVSDEFALFLDEEVKFSEASSSNSSSSSNSNSSSSRRDLGPDALGPDEHDILLAQGGGAYLLTEDPASPGAGAGGSAATVVTVRSGEGAI